jgi:protocatechuate 3,4-dioxygenase beta subunit
MEDIVKNRSERPTTTEYQGRRLPKPNEELVDQGLAFDLGTVVSRRRLLALFGAGAGVAGAGLLARGAGAFASTPPTTSVPTSEIPEETAGPYPGDGSNGPDVLEQSGIVRSDITTSFGDATGVAGGVPTTLEFFVYDLANGGVPFEGVAVYAWHCTSDGGYSMYSEGFENENYLRGVQIADADGKVTFTSIFPGCYAGRWPHVHFEVYPDEASITDSTNAIATSQLAFPADVCSVVYAEEGYEASVSNLANVSLDTDGIFSDDSAGTQLATMTGDVASGYHASLSVGVDTTTAAGGGGSGGGGMPGGAPPSGGTGDTTATTTA